MSRGLKNNNPLNIRRNNTEWKGLAKVQTDKSFFRFVAPEWGYRAAFITLRNYRKIHKLKTLRQWITRWAPPIENDTEAYISYVCNKCKCSPDEEPDINNKHQMCAIVSAMSFVENGVKAIAENVEKGWAMTEL